MSRQDTSSRSSSSGTSRQSPIGESWEADNCQSDTAVSKMSSRREETRRIVHCLVKILNSSQCGINFKKARTADVIKYVLEGPESPEKTELRTILTGKNEKRKPDRPFRTTQNIGSSTAGWESEMRTEYSRQYIKLAVSIILYSKKDARVMHLFELFFLDGNISPALIVGTSFIPLKWATRALARKRKTFQTDIPSSFSILIYLHALQYCSDKEGLTFKKNVPNGNRIGYFVQLLCNTWAVAAETQNCSFEDLILPYILFNREKRQFKVIMRRDQGFSPIEQRKRMDVQWEATLEQEKVDERAWKRSKEVDQACREVVRQFFKHLHDTITNSNMYVFGNDEAFLRTRQIRDLYLLESQAFPRVFGTFPIAVTSVLNWENSNPISIQDHGSNIGQSVQPMDVSYPETQDVINLSDQETEPSRKRRKLKNDILTEGILDGVKGRLTSVMHRSKLCIMHDVAFQGFKDLLDDTGNSGLLHDGEKGLVQLILTDPPYNTRRQTSMNNSEYDKITTSDMEEAATLFNHVLAPGGHGLVFCSALQFRVWYGVLSKCKVIISGHKSDESGTDHIARPLAFNVEKVPLHFIRENKQYQQNPSRKGPNHVNIIEHAIHFWRRRSPDIDGPMRIPNYVNTEHIKTSYPAWTNCTTGVKMTADELMFRGANEQLQAGKGSRIRQEQKSIALMRHLITHYTKPGEIVLDLFSGTFATGRACLTLPNSRRFVGCEKDAKCFRRAQEFVLNDFFDMVKNSSFPYHIAGLEEVQQDVELLKRHLVAERTSSRTGAGNPSPQRTAGLPMFQRFPPHITSFVSSMMSKKKLVLEYSQNPYDKWPEVAKNYLDSLDPHTLLSCEGVALGLAIGTSSIKHKGAGLGVFATRDFNIGEVVTYFYGTISYVNLENESKDFEFGRGIMGFSKDRFVKYAIQLERTKVNLPNGGTHYPIFIIPAPFCIAGYINDPSYREGDEQFHMKDFPTARAANIIAKCEHDRISPNVLAGYSLIEMEATRGIRRGEELFFSYSNTYGYF